MSMTYTSELEVPKCCIYTASYLGRIAKRAADSTFFPTRSDPCPRSVRELSRKTRVGRVEKLAFLAL